jgi:iron complex outermembrane receptor protein
MNTVIKILSVLSLVTLAFATAAFSQDTTKVKKDSLKVYQIPEVTVTATRSKDHETTTAFSNIDKETLRRQFFGQDAPQLLSELPSATFYSDNGNGIGYSYLKIRGFSQDRISVTLNGVPMNDAESHAVYWIDTPDLLANIEDVQVQRGVQQNAFGAASIGGSINLVTSNFSDKEFVEATYGGGSYDTRRFNLAMSSGLVANKYSIYARFSKITSDGYRENAFTDMYSYFLTAARFDDNMTTKLVLFGGPEKTHLAYDGITHDNLTANRKENDFTYPDATDNFNQPNYQLINEWQISPKVTLKNTLYYIKGDGYYTTQNLGSSLSNYGLSGIKTSDSTLYARSYYAVDAFGHLIKDANGLYTLTQSDVVTNLWLNLTDYGWIPELQAEHKLFGHDGKLTLGGEVRLHTGWHYGELVSGNPLPQGVGASYLYYNYEASKQSVSAYAHENLLVTNKINLMADLRLQSVGYKINHDMVYNYNYSIDYLFLNPRIGANVNLDEHWSVYGSFAYVQNEPTLSSLQAEITPDGEPPLFEPIKDASGNVIGYNYKKPLLRPEKLADYELGVSYIAPTYTVKLNGYFMNFKDELVYGGQLDNVGYPIYGNAENTRHMGIELQASAKTDFGLSVTGNLNVSKNYFVKYTEYTYDAAGNVVAYDRSGNLLADTPSLIANLRVNYAHKGFFASLAMQSVGLQYLDNSENERKDPAAIAALGYDKIVNAYTIFNFNASYKVENFFCRTAELGVFVGNVLNAQYEQTGGLASTDGSPRWFVGTPRNVFVTLKLGL